MSETGSFEGILIPENLKQTVRDIGGEAELWLDNLQEHVERRAGKWKLSLDEQLQHKGMCSIILGGRDAWNRRVILKLSVPHDEVRNEADAMRLWQDGPAAGLLNASDDGFDLLLARCDPGSDLWSLSIQEQIACASSILPRLWIPVSEPGCFRSLDDTAACWLREIRNKPEVFDLPVDLVNEIVEELQDLQSEHVCLLHGDFNPGNVILDGTDVWKVIDPKPWIGEPAFDLAQLIFNWIDYYTDRKIQFTDLIDLMSIHVDELSTRLGIDVQRILLWALLKSFGWFSSSQTVLLLHRLYIQFNS
ncbi:aminoglycoside phosphotransferase family protein [Spirochaeta dissipatitropha]